MLAVAVNTWCVWVTGPSLYNPDTHVQSHNDHCTRASFQKNCPVVRGELLVSPLLALEVSSSVPVSDKMVANQLLSSVCPEKLLNSPGYVISYRQEQAIMEK